MNKIIPTHIIKLATKEGYFARHREIMLNDPEITNREAYNILERELEEIGYDPRYISFESFRTQKYYHYKNRRS